MSAVIRAILGDITELDVDVLVNAANEKLMAGCGVCGAIHEAAGPELEVESLTLAPCKVGHAVITKAYRCKSKAIVHAVGPRHFLNPKEAPVLLASCYRESLLLAEKSQFSSIAFPCISTGVYGYPKLQAAIIAVNTVRDTLPLTKIKQVIFCCFDKGDLATYEKLLSESDLNSQIENT